MKRGTPDHPKMNDLAERLKIQVAHAAGLMECLWHWVAKFAPAGDIGRWTDAAIASGAKWHGDAAAFVVALVESRWLDKDEAHRLIVHDWPDHADEAVHAVLARACKTFVNGTTPKLGKLNKDERARADAAYSGGMSAAQKEHGGGMTGALPSQAKPSPALAMPCQANPSHEKPQPCLPREAREAAVAAVSFSSVSAAADRAEAAKAINALNVSQTVKGRLLACEDITAREVADVYAEIKANGTASNPDVVTASELLGRRGRSVRGEKGQKLTGPLSGALNGIGGTLEQIRRNRGYP